jgi:hypothetical protein
MCYNTYSKKNKEPKEVKMVYVVRKSNGEILYRADAWMTNSVESAERFAMEHSMIIIDHQITFNGDMVIWAE